MKSALIVALVPTQAGNRWLALAQLELAVLDSESARFANAQLEHDIVECRRRQIGRPLVCHRGDVRDARRKRAGNRIVPEQVRHLINALEAPVDIRQQAEAAIAER